MHGKTFLTLEIFYFLPKKKQTSEDREKNYVSKLLSAEKMRKTFFILRNL
jgi:hypothetical protein